MKKILLSFLMIGMAILSQAQTCAPSQKLMFFQDFEISTSSTLHETVNKGPAAISYYTVPGYTIGARSRAISNNLVDVDYGPVNASFATNVKISFSFAPIKIDDNPNDYLYFWIHAGASAQKIIIKNEKKSKDLSYNFSETIQKNLSFIGNNTTDIVSISDANKVNKIEISFPNTEVDLSQLKINVTGQNNNKDKYWIIDDIKIIGDFIDTKTWNGTSWAGQNNNPPTSSEIAIINGNYNTKTNGDISACKCTVNASKSLTIAADSNVILENDLINDGIITVESDGNLIQKNNIATFTGNNITVKRKATMKRTDYTYWGAPVAAQNLKSFAQNSQNNRFYTYNETTDLFVNIEPTTNSFIPAKGYAIRAPTNYSTETTADWVFTGVPNNGVKTIAIHKNGNGFNLISNPYPSNIYYTEFYKANSTIISDKAYFWTNQNTNPPQQQGSSYNGNNYATYTKAGGSPSTNSKIIPTETITVGQGFIVQKKSPGTENIIFNNSMRTHTKGQFFNARSAKKATTSRYWLKLTTPAKNFNTILVAYTEGATNGIDEDYDAEPLSLSSDLLYTIQDDKNFIIQGRDVNFDINDRIALGTNFFEPGNYEISILQLEGIFSDAQEIYLKDKQLNTTIKLTETPYQFYSEAGNITNRFEIIYAQESVLSTINANAKDLLIYENNSQIIIENKEQKITEIEVYDISGRLLISEKPNNYKAFQNKNLFQKGILIFKIKTKDKITSKKFLVK